jgi:PAS domain S-box-containing protein
MHARFNSLLARLLLSSGTLLVLFLAAVLVAALVISRLVDALNWEKHTQEVLHRALTMQQELTRLRTEALRLPLAGAAALPPEHESLRARFQTQAVALRELIRDNPDQQARLDRIGELEALWEEIVRDRLGKLGPVPGQSRAAFVQAARDFAESGAPVVAQLDETLGAFVGTEEGQLQKRRDETVRQTWQTVAVLGGVLALALVLGLATAWLSARHVTQPVRRLADAAGELLAGRFRSVPPAGPTEIAQLIVHFNHLGLTLAERLGTLEQQEERYRTYLGAVSHILWTTNAAGEVEADLPSWRAYTGQTEAEVRGRGWLDAIHPEDRPAAERAWEESLASRGLFEVEVRLRGRDGGYRHFHCRGVSIATRAGVLREWIGTCTDITRLKEESALRQAKEAAEAASQAKTEFLTRMSHELRTPLNAVIGMSRMLATERFGTLTAKQADYVQDITTAGQHLLALVNDILDLAQVETGRMRVESASFGLGEVLAAVASTLRPLAAARQVSLTVESPEQDGTLRTDPVRFRQVLYNLLSNAIKFTEAGGNVTLRGEWVEGPSLDAPAAHQSSAAAVRVRVRDTGVGIAAEDREVIWQGFRTAREGAGVGLALTRRLVTLLGGEIGLESTLGKGSTFTFVLPRRLPRGPS